MQASGNSYNNNINTAPFMGIAILIIELCAWNSSVLFSATPCCCTQSGKQSHLATSLSS